MQIYPSFDLPNGKRSNYCSFLQSVELLIEEMLPKEVLALKNDHEAFYEALDPLLPFIYWSQLKENGNAFELTVLSKAQYTHGTGRFLSDVLSRRLIPGKIVELVGTRSLSFFFYQNDRQEYFLNQRFIIAYDPESVELVRKNLPILAQELQWTLLSIFKVRHFLSLNPEHLEEAPILREPQHLSAIEEMHQVIQRLSAEKNAAQIRDYLAPLYQKRPKVFDRDIFEEIKPFSSFYSDKFIGSRKMRYIARLVCYHYYFKRQIEERMQSEPLSRQILLKVLRENQTLGVLLSINLFGENEVLKKDHLLAALQNCLPAFEPMADSFFLDASSEYRPILYMEVQKKEPITSQDIAVLRTKLPLELKNRIQSVLNPLFMLRNEEDQLRYMIALSRELRFLRDIPQVAISFEEQTFEELSFSVVLLRVARKGCEPLREMVGRLAYKTLLREMKTIGWIRNRHPKEVAIFKVTLPKKSFLRKNYSVDLPKARQKVLSGLNSVFKEVRDFNGGLLSKQIENLKDLKTRLGNIAEENSFPLENFFFSLEPLTAQTTLSSSLLKKGFLLLLNLIRDKKSQSIKSYKEGVISVFIVSSSEEKERCIAFLETARSSFELVSYSLTHIQEHYCLTTFFPHKDSEKQREFAELIACFAESRALPL
ncbi:MAG: hypothetical protein JSS32_00115 [Verrucomicrobia bacterium]|nr:hypothetical protein [Verrucomicrobiota bacterium]